ncbi:MAG: SAF domain-containing protein [Anaerolineaceae bacterium]|nr:SAF domain-containing protein [Anaerolineaceae bacterium]
MADQSQLLERYLSALRNDPDALPPPGLNPATAAFARKLVRETALSTLSDSARARMWRVALHRAQLSNHDTHDTQETNIMTTINRRQAVPLRGLTFLAVAMVAVLIGAALIVWTNIQKPNGNDPMMAALQSQNDSPTPTASPLTVETLPASPTPVLNPVDVQVVTATPVQSEFMTQAAPAADLFNYVPVVSAYVPITQGELIREDMLALVYWPVGRTPSDVFGAIEPVIGQYATQNIERFQPVFAYNVSSSVPEMLPTVPPPSPTLVPTATATHTPTVTASATLTPTPTITASPVILPPTPG